MSNTDKGNAKRASRATLELAKLLSDDQWHDTRYFAILIARYIRPEHIMRRARQHRQKDMESGQYQWALAKLRYWAKVGKVEKRIDDGVTKWRRNLSTKGFGLRVYVEWLEKGYHKKYARGE